jgi:flavin-dependent dehydrogenase
VIEDCAVSALVRDGGRVTGATGTDLRWSADVVIAADGYGSVGLAALGVPGPRGRYLGVSQTAYYRDVRFPDGPDVSDHYFTKELPYGYGWIFPAVDGVSNVGVYLRADAYARTGHKLQELMRGFLAAQRARFEGAELVGKQRVWSLPLAPRPIPASADGLLLVGDAGGFIDPFTGEGIWQGLYTGKLAGELVAEAALRGGRLTGAVRERYARECARAIGGPSRKKAWVQRGMALIVDLGLYRSAAVRSALRVGYQRRALEMTKS